MSFSRYKALTRLAQITSCNAESIQGPARRLYSQKVIISSASPHGLTIQAPKSRVEKKSRAVTSCNAVYHRNDKHKEQSVKKTEEFAGEILDDVDETVDNFERIVHQTKKVNKSNYKLSDIPYYQKELTFDDQITEVVQLKENLNISDNRLSDEENKNSLGSTQIETAENKDEADDELDIDQKFNRYKIIQTPEGELEFDLSNDEFNLTKYYKELQNALTITKPLDECKEDLSDFGPNFSPTFNFAAYADKSKLIQEFVKLGVQLYKVEKNQDHMRALLTVDLEKELPVYIQFLHDCGVPAECLGDVITQNPMILKEDLDDLKTRVRYLRAHDFAKESIARIVTKNPTWLVWATKKIDERLGHFQTQFNLTGSEVRFLSTKQPKLITYNMKHIHENTFAVKEQMGFSKSEMKVLLLAKPRIWMSTRKKILDSFDYLHNTMQLSHLMIASQPDLIASRRSRLKNRHEFLLELKKVQYDPKKPGYIAPQRIVFGSDSEFCRDIAKTSVETYNLFLKTR